jgi:monovalent cation:H+ antiporter-2, CPA2 family
MTSTLLSSIVIILGLTIVVLFACYRLHIPTIVGFLATGILAGPAGLKLIATTHNVEALSEIGVVLLLFSIGIEFSLKNLLAIKKTLLIGGTLQLVLTAGAVFGIARIAGVTINQSVFIGCLLSLSSTAIVLKHLQEKSEVESPHGKVTLGILIYQDIMVVPMMLLVPFLTGNVKNIGLSLGIFAVKFVAIIIIIVFGIQWIIPKILYQVAKTRSREIFLLSIIIICFSVAWLTSAAGLSLAFGAFLAGLILSESEYSYQALGTILPFRDVFTSIFFISIGMLFNVHYFLMHPMLIIGISLGVILVKALVAGVIPGFLGFPLRTMILVGLGLAQVGEFSFILMQTGASNAIINQDMYHLLLGVSILTMAFAPLIMASGSKIAAYAMRLPLPLGWKSVVPGSVQKYEPQKNNDKLIDHLIIIGYGINGKNVARAAKATGIPYIILEMNFETVRQEKSRGEPIFYGDATQETILLHANILTARVMVVGIPDPVATRRVLEMARKLNPSVHIIARTRFFKEMEPLFKLGASEVIPEEFETSVEIFTRVLLNYLVPREQIEQFVTEVRADGYQMFRSLSRKNPSLSDIRIALPDMQIRTLTIHPKSSLAGKTLADIELRKKLGVTLLAVRRNNETLSNPSGSTELLGNDIVVIMGKPENNIRIAALFTAKN